MKLIINLPGNDITGPCFTSIMKFIHYTQQYKDFDIVMNNAGGSHVGWVRERLMGWHTIEEISADDRLLFDGAWPDYDYILWLDSDIVFTPEDFMHLIDDDQDIVSGYYKIADGGDKSCVLEVSDKPDAEQSYLTMTELSNRISSNTLIEAQHVGFGFVLVKRGVFENVPKPYFMDQNVERNGVTAFVGEDVAFCVRARKAGYRIYVDPRVRLGHCKRFII